MNEHHPLDKPVESVKSADGDDAADVVLKSVAGQVHEILEAWTVHLVEAVASGRAATRIARMATARASMDLRRLSLPETMGADGDLREVTAAYLRRAASAVANAAHEIERNRYSLQAMQSQLQKLSALYSQICPEEAGVAHGDAPEPDDSRAPST